MSQGPVLNPVHVSVASLSDSNRHHNADARSWSLAARSVVQAGPSPSLPERERNFASSSSSSMPTLSTSSTSSTVPGSSKQALMARDRYGESSSGHVIDTSHHPTTVSDMSRRLALVSLVVGCSTAITAALAITADGGDSPMAPGDPADAPGVVEEIAGPQTTAVVDVGPVGQEASDGHDEEPGGDEVYGRDGGGDDDTDDVIRIELGAWKDLESCGPRLVNDVLGVQQDLTAVYFRSECAAAAACFGTLWVHDPVAGAGAELLEFETVTCERDDGQQRHYRTNNIPGESA
jgi:hypothetical protein